MAKTSWVDRVLSKLPEAPDNSAYFDLVDTNGQVVQENVKLVLKNPIIQTGTPVNAQNLNNLEDRVDNAVPKTRKINNKELSSDITLTAADVGAAKASDIEIKLDKITSGSDPRVYYHNGNYQGDLGIDTAPLAGSNNLVTSNGTYCAIQSMSVFERVWAQGESLSGTLQDGEYCVKGLITDYCSPNQTRKISFPMSVYCQKATCGCFAFRNIYCENSTPAQFSFEGSDYCNPLVTITPVASVSTGANPVQLSVYWIMHPSEGSHTRLYPGSGCFQITLEEIFRNKKI